MCAILNKILYNIIFIVLGPRGNCSNAGQLKVFYWEHRETVLTQDSSMLKCNFLFNMYFTVLERDLCAENSTFCGAHGNCSKTGAGTISCDCDAGWGGVNCEEGQYYNLVWISGDEMFKVYYQFQKKKKKRKK